VTRTDVELRAAYDAQPDPAALDRLSRFAAELGAPPGRGQRRRAQLVRLAPLSAGVAVLLIVIGIAAGLLGRADKVTPADTRPPTDIPTTSSSSPLPSSPAPTAVVSRLPPVYLGPLGAQTTAAGGSLLLDAPNGRTAKLTPTQGYRIWCAAHRFDCSQPGPAEIQLAILTTPNSGPTGPDGQLIRPGVDHVLSYVITWHNVECPNHGGGAYPGRSPSQTPTPTLRCTEVNPVNANTGTAIAGTYYNGS
jgi:hypothetical protein